ncbi:hypothetical protein C3L33_23489, partial [Rhododendron williamsianum]
MRYMRTGSLKRLFSIKRRSFEADVGKQKSDSPEEDNNEASNIFPGAEPFKRPTWKCFSFEQIFVATNGFCSENMVGKGGYVEVYRGTIEDGEAIAVKRLTKESTDERKEKDFLTEIGTLAHVCHPNVSSLLGCCIDNGLYLVFQFSSRGSVASVLHGIKSQHKHENCDTNRNFVHNDISDFGLAKWLPSQWTHHSITPIEGTFGHLAPEYFMHGVVDEKTDVFAFGVLLLELISGKKPVDASHQSLHSWAKPILSQGEIEKLVDPRLGGAYDDAQLDRLAFAASLCIRASSTWRPTISQ